MSFKMMPKILSIYFVLLGFNLAHAQSWESCISGALAQCGTFGGDPNIYACDDWSGEMEACFSCTDIPGDDPMDPPWEFFLGCGGPEPSKLHNNAECSSCPSTQAGSIIDETHRNYIKSVPVRGTNLSLVYASNKVVERSDDYKIDFEVFETTPTFISSYDVKISIAGRVITFTNPASTHNVVWTWDKLNNLSQVVKKPMPVILELTMAGQTIPMEFVLGNANIEQYGLGSWAISNHHFYGAEAKRLYLGSGEMLNAESVSMGGGIRAVISDTSDEVYTFDGRGYHISTVHALTGETLQSFSYNGSGHLTKITDAYGNETLILRDGSGNFTGVESPDGQVTTSALTSNKVTSFTTPEGDIYSMTYNTSSAMLETFTKPTGQVTTFHLDAGGSLEKVSYNGGNFFEYLFGGVSDNVKEYVRETALGREKTIRVSQVPGGILTETVSPLGVTESVGELFGAEGGFEWKKGDSERTTEMTEDPRFGGLRRVPSKITEKEGSKTRLTQYSRSAVLSNPLDVFSIITLTTTQNMNGRISSDVYTNSTKTWLSTSPEGRTLKAVIDEYGSPISEQVGSLSAVGYDYDLRGRLTKITQGLRETELTYNVDGFVSQVENALGQVTTYTYDDDGKLESATLPDLRVVGYKYDAHGNLLEITPSGKPKHNFLYNAFELIQEYLPPVLGGTPRPTNYVYNNDKELIQIEKSDGTEINYNRNATTGVLDSITVASTTLYAYDYSTLSGNLTEASSIYDIKNTMVYEGNLLESVSWVDLGTSTQLGKLSNVYDNNFWITSQSVHGGVSSTPSVIAYGHDDDGLIISAGAASYDYRSTDTLLSEMNLGLLEESYAYNSFGELTGKDSVYNTSAVWELDYTRDLLGRVQTKTESDGVNTHVYEYIYDVSGRLEEVKKDAVTISTYVYDGNNNRTGGSVGGLTTTATYDNQDRLLTYNNLTFTYNHNGERTGRTDTSTSQTTSYEYNVFGQLEKVTLPSTDEIEYAYDGLGRRVGRSFNSTPTHMFAYENSRIVAEINPSTLDVHTRYVYVSQGHSPDYMIRGGETYGFIKDHLGSIQLVVKISDGSVVQKLVYDEFGKVLSDTNPGFQPFGFAGGVYDAQANLTKFGVRDYDAEVGRWISKDPILFDGGDTNLYGYVVNDPVNLIDPEGESHTADAYAGGGGGGVGSAPIPIPMVPAVPMFLDQMCAPSDSDYSDKGSNHKKNKRESNREKHEKGDSRRNKDKGGEKGDKSRKRYK